MLTLKIGSQAHGISLPVSDSDIFILDPSVDYYEKHYQNGVDTHRGSLAYLKKLFGESPPWYSVQIICPAASLEESAVADYLEQNREEIAEAKKSVIYPSLLKRADSLYNGSANLYALGYGKRVAYSILCYSILANYADGMSFLEACRPEGALHDFLIGVRLLQVAPEDVLARLEQERLRAKNAGQFYDVKVSQDVIAELIKTAEKEMRANV